MLADRLKLENAEEVEQKYMLKVNADNKATELPLCRIGGTVQKNPHMRAFWGATISFFLAFLGWFALAPLGLDVAKSIGICENDLFPPEENPTRKAYLKFKNIKTLKSYCRFGKKDDLTDCMPNPSNASDTDIYDTSVLTSCVCTPGTKCRSTLADSGVASVASTIFVRVALGSLLERFGPVNTQAGLLTFGSLWIFAAAGISADWNFILIRFFIGAVGGTFVTNQFWCSLMFAPSIVGTANATAAGWGNLGGGVTQIFMVLVLFEPFKASGMSANSAWRVSMFIPAIMFLICAASVKLLCWDTPTKRRFSVDEVGKKKAVTLADYMQVLRDPRVVVMIFQYSACFGTELAMNNQLATHFRTYFQMKAGDAASLAASFGCMNLFARSLGGISSDVLFNLFGFRGRIWAQFLSLFFEAIFLFAFGTVDNTRPWGNALVVLIFFSVFVQMAEGTSYGIVPFMNKQQLAVVSALVGAGGNLGAVIAGFCFYKPIDHPLTPFKVHAAYVMFWALLSPLYYWPEYGGMFSDPAPEFRSAALAEERKKDGPKLRVPDSTSGGGAASMGRQQMLSLSAVFVCTLFFCVLAQ